MGTVKFSHRLILGGHLFWTLNQVRKSGDDDDDAGNMQYTCRMIQPLNCEADKNFFKNVKVINDS